MDTENSSAPAYKNRKVGLVIFGILTMVGGCLCFLFALFAALAPMIAAQSPNPPPAPIHPLPGVVMSGGLAILLIWLGIGSIKARRWARTLLAVISWSFFVFGISGLVTLAALAPKMKAMMAAQPTANGTPLSESAQTAMLIGMFLFAAVFTIIGPLIWALFYSGRNVKATCEALDPTPRWTDRCPGQVLAVSLWLFFGGLCVLGMSLLFPIAPWFGLLISGNLARIYHVCVAAIWLYCAWALYRLDRRAWWIVFIAMTASLVSSVLTFSHHDISEIYTLMGYSAQQIAFVRQTGFANRMILWPMIGTLPALGYLIYIRKFLRPAGLTIS